MTKKSVRGEFNTFVKGLITDASPLNFPEQAAKDIVNFELNRNGTLYRRLGFGLEPSYEYRGTSATSPEDIATYVWEEPASVAKDKFLVVTHGTSISFYSLADQSITSTGFLGSLDLGVSSNTFTKQSFSGVDGNLVIATGKIDNIVIEYNPNSKTFSRSFFRLKTRDIWGVDNVNNTGNDDYRPTVRENVHLYNLYNAGWAIPRRGSGLSSYFVDPSKTLFGGLGYYPAESDSVWSSIITVVAEGIPVEVVNTTAYRESLGASSAPLKGHFVIDLLNRGQSRSEVVASNSDKFPEADLSTFTSAADTTTSGSSVVCEHSGRVFYAGFGDTVNGDKRSPDLSNFVAFSRLVRNIADLEKCYQEGDPTSRESNDIIDTDGGLIRVSGAVGIYNLVSLGRNLVVCASNGIWSIEGGSDYGFTASNYKVNRLTSFGVSSGNSVVTDGSVIYYWGETGIYVISRNEFGDLVVKSLTEITIESFYSSISESARSSAKGAYDKVEKKIRWIYPETSWDDFTATTNELVLDLSIGAFYLNKMVSYSGCKVFDLFITPSFSTVNETGPVMAGADTVVAGVDSVIADVDVRRTGTQSIKYLVAHNNSGLIRYTVGWHNDQTFTDWFDVDGVGVDAKAYLLTGAITASDSSVHKQTPIFVVHMERTEDALDSDFELANQSGCFTRVMWDFASSVASKKFSPLFQVYRLKRAYIPATPGPYDNGFELITSRNKLRGRGRALSIYMETEVGKDCRLVGWNLSMNGNAVA